MPTRDVPVKPEAVLAAVEARLASQLMGGNGVAVYATLDDREAPEPPGDYFATVRPWDWPIDLGNFAGGGNATLLVRATLRVTLWMRRATDPSRRDSRALKDATNGLLARWRALMKALSGYDPDDGATPTAHYLLAQGMRCRRAEFLPRRAQTHWYAARSVFEAVMWVDLT